MKAGDKVTWQSQAGGSWTEKTGTVIREILPGESAKSYIPNSAKKGHIKFGDKSSNERVLVAVPAGKDGQITHYYCPRKNMLTVKED